MIPYTVCYDYTMKCRKAGVATTIWERDMPSKKTWDSLSVYPAWQYLQSYFTVPISDNNILCYYENIRAGAHRILNSLYFFNARNGELLKEIKFDDYLPELGKNMVIVKDSIAYYPMLKWGY